MLIIFNWIGLGLLAAGFGLAYAVGLLVGATSEDALMLMAGPLLFIGDMIYRDRTRRAFTASTSVAGQEARRHWWYGPRFGGHLVFIPIWVFGLFWMGLGTFRLAVGN